MRCLFRTLITLSAIAMLAACGNNEAEKPPYSGIKLGKPYEVYGRWYKPHYDPNYDEIGLASWYGPTFHGKHSANGETFDENELTAAHKTLPLPSIVRVTNLDNGRSAIIKINDRGPFVANRIIDLSKASAKKLGVFETGIAKVRVQFLAAETRQYAQLHHIDTSIYAQEIPQNQWHKETEQADLTSSQVAAFANAPYVSTAPTMGAEDRDPAPFQHTIAPLPAQQNAIQDTGIFSVVDEAQASPAQEAASSSESYDNPATVKENNSRHASEESGFFVQAGTFSVKHNAEILQQKIASIGSVSIKPMTRTSKILYRVVAGPYDTKEHAKKLLSKLAALGITDAKITFD